MILDPVIRPSVDMVELLRQVHPTRFLEFLAANVKDVVGLGEPEIWELPEEYNTLGKQLEDPKWSVKFHVTGGSCEYGNFWVWINDGGYVISSYYSGIDPVNGGRVYVKGQYSEKGFGRLDENLHIIFP